MTQSAAHPAWRCVGIVGVGLIGGSMAAALRQARQAERIVGVDANPGVRQEARALGLVDAVSGSIADLLACDLVVLAAPVARNVGMLASVALWLAPDAILTDVGSTKGDFCSAAQTLLSADQRSRTVPAHPIAGGDATGPAAARADLFAGRRTLITPLADSNELAIGRVEALWQALGAKVQRIEAAAHDAALAAVSHLPHLLAFAAMNQLAAAPSGAKALALAGPGFRDFSRIAAGDPTLWAEALHANREQVLRCLDTYQQQLFQARQLLEADDVMALQHWIEPASRLRQAAKTQLT